MSTHAYPQSHTCKHTHNCTVNSKFIFQLVITMLRWLSSCWRMEPMWTRRTKEDLFHCIMPHLMGWVQMALNMDVIFNTIFQFYITGTFSKVCEYAAILFDIFHQSVASDWSPLMSGPNPQLEIKRRCLGSNEYLLLYAPIRTWNCATKNWLSKQLINIAS